MDKKKLMRALYKAYPRKEAEEWDFIGLQCGKFKDDIKKVLVCLDFDETIIDVARDFKPDMILTHHPFIFGKRKEVLADDALKIELVDILENELECAVVSFHTNFDSSWGGMNDLLAERLHLINVYRPEECKTMRIGELENAMEVEVFVSYFMSQTHVTYASLVDAGSQTIRKVAFICGAGSGYFKVAKQEGADIYISGDCPHHIRRDVIRYGMNYLDVPHEIERMFVGAMENKLKEIDSSLEVLAIDHETEATMHILSV